MGRRKYYKQPSSLQIFI